MFSLLPRARWPPPLFEVMPVSSPDVVVLCGRSAVLSAGVQAAMAKQAPAKIVKLRMLVSIENTPVSNAGIEHAR